MQDEQLIKLGAQVQGLELLIKSMIALQFAATVRDEAGFVKAAGQVRDLSKHLQEHLDAVMKNAPDNAVRHVMEAEIRSTVRRCLEGAEGQLQEVAKVVLALSDPASPAKN